MSDEAPPPEASEVPASTPPAETPAEIVVEPPAETPAEVGVVAPADDAAARALARRREARTTRLVLPLLIPIGALLVIGFFVLNVSRVFLAAAEGDSTIAVAIAAGITVTILAGATLISALPRVRTSPLVITVGAAMALVLISGSIVLGASEPEKKAKPAAVTGPSINTLEVTALPTLKFDKKAYTAPAGINTIKYIDGGGTHTFVFDGAYPGFELQVPPTSEGKIELKPGTYTFFCSIPGHRAAGMEATLTVTAGGAASTPTTAGGAGTTATTAAAG